jgi:hypothetical protein
VILAVGLGIAAIALGALAYANRPRRVPVDAVPPAEFPRDRFAHDVFETLLRRFVAADGSIAYQRWSEDKQSVEQLHAYLAAVSRFSPENSPDRFASNADELAYWIYAYNAYVIKSVLDHWPVASVMDVKAPLEPIKGMGFFFRLRYPFGGRYLSLLAVENNRIRRHFRDPRIHFVLSCASGSCPAVRPALPTGDALDALLAEAAADFVSNPRNVFIDHDEQRIAVSRIFKWYKSDFLNELRLRGLSAEKGIVDYIRLVAPASLASELSKAPGYELVYRDYDWALNAAADDHGNNPGASRP